MNFWNASQALRQAPRRERIKLALGSLLFPGPTRAWLSFVQADALLWRQVLRSPKFVTRIFRPYALRSLSLRERVQLMIGHYSVLHRLGLRQLLEASVDAPLKLLDLPTKNHTPAHLELVSVHDGQREGEAHLLLHWNGQWLYSLSFVLREQDSRHACQLLVTRLQGPGDEHARERIRAATKGLYGLRPAALLVHVARQMALSVGCGEVLLVSHRLRVALNPVRRWKMPNNLEGLWNELGAQPHHSGLFQISPAVEIAQDFSELPSSKRAEARRKAHLLQHVLDSTDQKIRSLARAPQAGEASGGERTHGFWALPVVAFDLIDCVQRFERGLDLLPLN